jgi:hypothetical protein
MLNCILALEACAQEPDVAEKADCSSHSDSKPASQWDLSQVGSPEDAVYEAEEQQEEYGTDEGQLPHHNHGQCYQKISSHHLQDSLIHSFIHS